MTTLISFLGKGRREKETNRYKSANYRFDGGCARSSYFGLALARQLKVSKLVILGTAGSIWDVFAEDLADDEAALNTLTAIGLDQAVAHESVVQEMLDALAPLLRSTIGIDVIPALIPYARDEREQFDVLRTMAEHVGENEHLVLDVTHGFRHFPSKPFAPPVRCVGQFTRPPSWSAESVTCRAARKITARTHSTAKARCGLNGSCANRTAAEFRGA